MDDSLNRSLSGRNKRFLIKRKVPDDAKVPKNLIQLPGLPNVLIQATSSGQQFHKPNSAQTEQRKSKDPQKKMNTSFQKQVPVVKQSDVFVDSGDPQLTEINENSFEEEDRNNLVEGPQLTINKEFIAFLSPTNEVGFDDVLVMNNGSASIYYEWKRINGSRINTQSLQDTTEERFFCHHEQNVIKPGEQIKFVFSFLSKVTGVFNEEWHLKCEPPTRQPLPNLKLSGQAFIEDELVDWRAQYERELNQEFTLKAVNEVIGDILENVKTPTPPPPDLDDPEQAKVEFEELNIDEKLWYTKETVTFLQSSFDEVQAALQKHETWNLDAKRIHTLLEEVDEDDGKEFIERKLKVFTKLAKKTPLSRSSIFTAASKILMDVAVQIPEISDNLRKELEMWDSTWREDEDPIKKAEELVKVKAEWLKKAKKKKWNEELEKELIDEYRNKLTSRVMSSVIDQSLRLTTEGDLMRVQQLLNPQLKWDYFRRMRVTDQFWDMWMRKKTIVDAEIEGKRVALRIHIKIKDGAQKLKITFEEKLLKFREEEEKRQEEERLERERIAKENSKKKGKGKPQQQQQQTQKKDENSQYQLDLSHIDPECLQEALEMIKNIMERQCKLLVLIVSYDRPYGRHRWVSSVRFFHDWLKQNIEQPVFFSDNHIVENFEENVENQIWPDNSAVVLENLFFESLETGIQIDDDGNVYAAEQPDDLNQSPYYRLLPYAPTYILGDKVNIFNSQYPSINDFKVDQFVLGSNIVRDIQTIFYQIQAMNEFKGVILLGGELSADKLLAIDTLVAHTSTIVLLGKIGFAFFCTINDIETDLVPQIQRVTIKQLLECHEHEKTVKPPEKLKRVSHVASPPKPRAKLVIPNDFLMTMMPEGQYDPANPDHLSLVLNSISPYKVDIPSKKLGLKPNQILLDFGPETLQLIEQELSDAQRFVWMDSANLSLHNIEKTITIPDLEAIALLNKLKEEEAQREIERLEKLKDKKGGKNTKKQVVEEKKPEIEIKTTKEINVPVFNETNRSLGQILYNHQVEKRENREKAQKGGMLVDYGSELVITLVGSQLEEELNREDFAALTNDQVEMEQQENPDFQEQVEDVEKSQASQPIQQEKVKVNQVKQYLSDFYVRDQEFVLKVIGGEYISCLSRVDEYPKKTNSEIDEEEFLDQSP